MAAVAGGQQMCLVRHSDLQGERSAIGVWLEEVKDLLICITQQMIFLDAIVCVLFAFDSRWKEGPALEVEVSH